MKNIMNKTAEAVKRVSFARGEKGITLVALIITIIVLIILAAVTIITFTETGLLQTASKGAENYANAQNYEQKIMDNIDKKANDIVKNIADIQGDIQEEGPVSQGETADTIANATNKR